MNFISKNLKTKGEYVDIVAVSCLHIGNACFNEERANAIRQYIIDNPDTYAIEMGDTTENAIKSSKGTAIFRQVIPPSVQLDRAVEFWKPVVKAKKLILKHNSNHSFRSEVEADFSPDQYIARLLDVPFAGWDCLSTIKVNKEEYTIHSVHGKRGGTTPAAALNACMDQSKRAIADIYLRAHHHKCIFYSDIIKEIHGKQVVNKKRSYGVTGAFLDWDNSYAELFEYPISSQGCLVIRLYANRHDSDMRII